MSLVGKGGTLGKVVGIIFLLVLMALILLSYMRFVLKLNFKNWRDRLRTKTQLNDIFPELSYSCKSPYATPVEEFDVSCGWND